MSLPVNINNEITIVPAYHNKRVTPLMSQTNVEENYSPTISQNRSAKRSSNFDRMVELSSYRDIRLNDNNQSVSEKGTRVTLSPQYLTSDNYQSVSEKVISTKPTYTKHDIASLLRDRNSQLRKNKKSLQLYTTNIKIDCNSRDSNFVAWDITFLTIQTKFGSFMLCNEQ